MGIEKQQVKSMECEMKGATQVRKNREKEVTKPKIEAFCSTWNERKKINESETKTEENDEKKTEQYF